MALRSRFALVSTLVLLAAELPAQTAAGPTALVGTVREAGSGRPLPAALVSLRGTPHRTLTDREGEFRLAGVAPGRYSLEVRVIGHEPQTVPVAMDDSGPTRIPVELAIRPIALAPVEVEAPRTRRADRMRGFYERMARGRGHFVTRAQIQERHPRTLAQTLEMVPGIRIVQRMTPFGTEHVVQTGRNVFAGGGGAPSYECPVGYFLDGMPFRPMAIGSETEIRPAEIEGIEVYLGPATVPPEFNRQRNNAACGVVVIWTRTGP